MSFYDDASLVFLAGAAAGKDGKAYNLKPTDGSGDFTFTRGTNLAATRVGKDGYIEKGRENLLLQSNQFDTTWTLNSASLTSGQSGYDGSNDAWELKATGDGVTNLARVSQGSLSVSGVSTFSVYVKAGNTDFVRINLLPSGSPNCNNYFDVANGSVGSSPSGSVAHSSITAAGNGFYRISLTHDGSGGSINEVRIQVAEADGDDIPATNSYIYIQDAQLEQGLVATDYIETGATTATAGLLEDEPRFDYTGGGCPALLLEPARTNLVSNSEYFGDWSEDGTATVTLNQTTSPEGLTNAALLDYGASPAGPDRVSTTATITGSTVYAFSVFAKAKDASKIQLRNYHGAGADASAVFNLAAETITVSPDADSGTIEDYGNGWYRCTLIFTSDSADTSADLRIGAPNIYSDSGEEIYIYGAQLEEGSYATSYIPTYGSSATRAKEGASDSYDQISTLDLSSNGLNGEDVSWFFEFRNNQDIIRDGSDPNVRVSEDLTNVGALRIYRGVTSTTRLKVVLTANSGTSPTAYTIASDNPKVLIKRTWSTGRIQVYVDGVSVKDEINLNFDRWYKLDLAGHGSLTELKQVLAFPMVLSNNDSEILTGATSYSSFAAMATSTDLNYTLYE